MSDHPPNSHANRPPDVRNVFMIELPLAEADHVLIERTAANTYRVVGRVNHAKHGHYKPPQFAGLADALAASEVWAIAHGVKVIYVCDTLPSILEVKVPSASEMRFRVGLGNL